MNATGTGGASNIYGSATVCAPPMPPPPPPEDGSGEACNGIQCEPKGSSPIIVNLTDGPWTMSGPDDPVSFDIDADGTADRITWTGRGESLAFLALDRNGNGAIDGGAELFGTATRLVSGGVAANGFEALIELDANGDGLINSSDPVWGRLILWTDEDHDGVSGSGEMRAIGSSGVAGLGTRYREARRIDRNQNQFRYMGLLVLEGGSQRPYYDVFFRWVP